MTEGAFSNKKMEVPIILQKKGYYTVTVTDENGNLSHQYLQKSLPKSIDECKEIPCNMCGLSCEINDNSPATANYGLINASVAGGYPSTPGNGNGALDDCVTYNFSLCEFCLDFMFSKFTLPPRVYDVSDPGGNDPFFPAKERVERDDWRKSKSLFYKQAEERDNARSIK